MATVFIPLYCAVFNLVPLHVIALELSHHFRGVEMLFLVVFLPSFIALKFNPT
ncbi:hypothetical protein M405DRAFT_829260 [Rhizopogon salebrosus TDB-379]|nr:hypothetical protein M405DRAFT_829260 [Rhizopogon salebrosus TDB-379]